MSERVSSRVRDYPKVTGQTTGFCDVCVVRRVIDYTSDRLIL